MTKPLTTNEYTEFLAKEYLLDYVRTGGAAIKFCVGTPGPLAELRAQLQSLADDNNYSYAGIDATDTKVSMTDQLLFALTRTLDIPSLGQNLAAAAYQRAGFPSSDADDLHISAIAGHYQVDPGELYRSVRRRLEEAVLADRFLPRDLRLCLFRLAQHALGVGDVNATEAEALANWLTGRPARAAAFRASGIRYRITRANAHPVLAAILSGVAMGDRRGLIVSVDLERLGVDRSNAGTEGHYYTKAARLDAYEVLRELVDATDSLHHCLLVITVPSQLFDDPARGPFAYPALAMRLFDDVADRQLSNPFTPVVQRVATRTIMTASLAPTANIDALAARRAVEAFRSGVPSTTAIASLDSLQPDINNRFSDLCSELRSLPGSGRPAKGLLIGGGFGTGKTHLLAHLRAQAARDGFVTSVVTISKEVPLHDPVRVGRAILASATLDGVPRDVIERLADQIDVNDARWADLNSSVRRLDTRFAASVALYGRPGTPDEINEHLIRFWAGEPLHLPTVRRALKGVDQPEQYSFERIADRDLWAQRVGFAARLARAAGHPGWVVTFDEAELIGRYPTRQRLRSYAELGRWLRRRPTDPTAPLAAVVAVTDDYQAAILDHKGDRHLPSRLPDRLEDPHTASAAEVGIKLIQRDLLPLQAATTRNLNTIKAQLQTLHATAYNWAPPPAPGLPPRSTHQLRHHIRAWINQWDIYRRYPTFDPDTELRQIPTNWDEDPTLST